MSTATLTSLAILKVHMDAGRDYLDYLRPFVLQVLFDERLGRISDEHVANLIRQHFGLVIPSRTIQVVLRRLARRGVLTRSHGVYIPKDISDPGIHANRADAVRQIKATIAGLIEYAQSVARVKLDVDEATNAICSFLSHFDISCLRAYLRNTTIPNVSDSHGKAATLVSKYVMHIRDHALDVFENFMVVVQGHMLANALLCPDLKTPATYRGVTFYLDTPLLVHALGLEGQGKRDAIMELIRLLETLGGSVATFSHLRDELDRVLHGAADHINDVQYGRGGIVMEARRNGTTRSDLLLLAATADDELDKIGLQVFRTPEYAAKFQIDETAFEDVLDDEVSYYNDRARAFDVNSVRSIYALRRGKPARFIERCNAILVTSNSGFARAAWHYGRTEEMSKDVSSVISDFSVANLAWLKAPLGASSLPVAEVMAFCYAAARSSRGLIDKFLREIDKLHAAGRVSEREHRLLRSSQWVYDDLMDLTLGDERALTEESVLEALERVTDEIRAEQAAELSAKERAHSVTQRKLWESDVEVRKLRDALYWRCVRKAKLTTVLALGTVGALVAVGGFAQSPQIGYWLVKIVGSRAVEAGSHLHLVVSTLSLLFGVGVMSLYRRIYVPLLRWFTTREELLDDAELRRRLETRSVDRRPPK